MLKEGTKAPNFNLKGLNERGEESAYNLEELLKTGKDIVIYFYPKDDTPGCTTEACDFRDNFNRVNTKALVLGVSPDSVESHKKFKEKHNLNFPLLSDTDHKILESYEAWGDKTLYGKTYKCVIRSTFIIDKKGTLKKAWKNVKVNGHVDAVLEELNK
jgi:peroxiredoxin Q/BCP